MTKTEAKLASVFEPQCWFNAGDKSYWGRLCGSSKALAISRLVATKHLPICILTTDSLTACRLAEAIRFYMGGPSASPLLFFPDWETLPYDLLSPCQDITSERLATLAALPDLGQGILITKVTTAMHRLMPKNFLLSRSIKLQLGQRLDPMHFKTRLIACGYMPSAQVMAPGELAIRGSLIDLYPMGASQPYRIDLLDEEIDSIRTFDPETQRSYAKVREINVLPAKEVPLDRQSLTYFKAAWQARFPTASDQCALYRDLTKGLPSAGIEYYLPLFFSETSTLFDYLPERCLIILDEDINGAMESFWGDIETRFEQGRRDPKHPLMAPTEIFLSPQDLINSIQAWPQLRVTRRQQKDGSKTINYATTLPENLPIKARIESPLTLVNRYLADFTGRVLLVVSSAGRREILLDLFKQQALELCQFPGWSAFINGTEKLGLTVAPLEQGLQLTQLAVISEAQLFGERTMQRRLRKTRPSDPALVINNLTELTVDTLVVHEAHGIGRYKGLVHASQLISSGAELVETELIHIEYARGCKLYVPVYKLDLISRYTSGEGACVHLHELGNDHWQKTKRKIAGRIRDVAAELLEMHAQREARTGYSFSIDESAYYAFVQGFPFELTSGQMDAIEAVLKDMRQAQPMDRLICGDAGFGKTEVAMRAAFVAVQNGKQVAILAPTTLLAQQHYQTFKDRFADWPVHIELLSRFRSGKAQAKAITGLENGVVDIVIATHKLIYRKINFARLGLLVIDEEHRFGVRQKEKFRAFYAGIDLLTLTATPIPRTLNIALSELRELSIITTPPARRIAVKTFVCEWDDAMLREAALREMRRGGQVYILHNEVETIEQMAKKIISLLPEARVATAHGQMPERLLEQIMLDFYHRRFNVLVCTTIIETGIDIPSANTIIIHQAEKLGLAQLYQLRGRVGRAHHQAYAYLLTSKNMTQAAAQRLEAVEAMQGLGIGFTLAMHDLEIRGAGEILGESQSGHIQAIGYGLYLDLLGRAVRALKSGQQPKLDGLLESGLEIELHVPVLIPEDYLPDVHLRLMMYKRIAGAKDEHALQALQIEMIDRFGLLPDYVQNLFQVTRLKLLAKPLGVSKIDLSEHGGYLKFHPVNQVDPGRVAELIQTQPSIYTLSGPQVLKINAQLSVSARMALLTDLLNQLSLRHAA